ncbi:hypothetical protein BC477_06530 [Clavibacter michiganensis subsp. michiganensis]|uniref:Uncharacterized protein n=1 Tax=Clavibacter michiganensis subsp. michiganensis TaxID=33013 RepID=A0A251XMD5_CLAMM|nr:hypothetical protein BC477_06530 [Clavibacter michiganensis subsp. michiganensis]OUE04373.1 hypothetical protein CMMCAS07_05460 [Clavibacter michiganensis subsp. michiganensis]
MLLPLGLPIDGNDREAGEARNSGSTSMRPAVPLTVAPVGSAATREQARVAWRPSGQPSRIATSVSTPPSITVPTAETDDGVPNRPCAKASG